MVDSRCVITVRNIPVREEIVDIAFSGDLSNTESIFEYALDFAQKRRAGNGSNKGV
jgi:hypothetical protein